MLLYLKSKNYTIKMNIMEKVLNKGSATAKTAIKRLLAENRVKVTDENVFRSVLKTLRTAYSEVINTKNVTVNYGNCEITID